MAEWLRWLVPAAWPVAGQLLIGCGRQSGLRWNRGRQSGNLIKSG